MRLNTLHNLHFYQTFFRNMRAAIEAGKFGEYKRKVGGGLRIGSARKWGRGLTGLPFSSIYLVP